MRVILCLELVGSPLAPCMCQRTQQRLMLRSRLMKWLHVLTQSPCWRMLQLTNQLDFGSHGSVSVSPEAYCATRGEPWLHYEAVLDGAVVLVLEQRLLPGQQGSHWHWTVCLKSPAFFAGLSSSAAWTLASSAEQASLDFAGTERVPAQHGCRLGKPGVDQQSVHSGFCSLVGLTAHPT